MLYILRETYRRREVGTEYSWPQGASCCFLRYCLSCLLNYHTAIDCERFIVPPNTL